MSNHMNSSSSHTSYKKYDDLEGSNLHSMGTEGSHGMNSEYRKGSYTKMGDDHGSLHKPYSPEKIVDSHVELVSTDKHHGSTGHLGLNTPVKVKTDHASTRPIGLELDGSPIQSPRRKPKGNHARQGHREVKMNFHSSGTDTTYVESESNKRVQREKDAAAAKKVFSRMSSEI